MEHAGWRSRGYIPHCDGAGIIHHIVMSAVGPLDAAGKPAGLPLFAAPDTAAIIENAILHFDGIRYRVLAWCVMSTHAHVVVEQMQGWPLANVVHSWKSFTANAVNVALHRSGPVWMREYFDRFMRTDNHLANTIAYVERNPVAAGLVERPEDWRWSSARRRSGA
jgi:putative transposase